MSDFRETIKQLSNTPEQYEQQLMKEQATKKAIEFCHKLKNEIKNRANRGLYQVCGENRIIKIFFDYSCGASYHYDDDDDYFKCLSSNKCSNDRVNNFSGEKLNAGMVTSHEDCISRETSSRLV